MNTIKDHLNEVRENIRKACEKSGRSPKEVTLIAVSKTKPLFMLEEAYEAVEAIDEKDPGHLKEELGDVLLQVVFHARMAEEEGLFTLDDVVDGICEKMIRRHPHVFGDAVAETPEESLALWQAIKKQEKAKKP